MSKSPGTFGREVRGIAGHGVLYMLAALASKAIGFFMIPVYTSKMDKPEYGVLEMLDLVVQITAMIFAFGLANAAMRYHAQAKERDAAKRVISTAQLASIAISSLGALLIFALAGPIAEHLIDGRPVRLVWYVAGSTLGAGISGIPLAYLRIQARSKLYVAISMGQLLLALSLNILFVVFMDMKAEGVLLSGLITQLSVGTVLTVITFRDVGFGFDSPVLGKLARFGAPLLLASAGTMLMTSGDRYIVKEQAGLDEVGLYGLGYQLGFVIQVLIVGPFFLIWQPRSYAIEKDPTARTVYARVFTLFFSLLLFGAVALSVMAQDVVRLMTPPEYHPAWRFVPWIAFAGVFNGVQQYCRIGIYLKEKTGHAGVIMLVTAIVSLTIAWFVTGAFGATGAAIVSFGSYAVLATAMAIASRRMYEIPYERTRLLKPVFAVALVGALAALNPFDGLALSIVWNASTILVFPIALFVLRFFNAEEHEWMRDRLVDLRARWRARANG